MPTNNSETTLEKIYARLTNEPLQSAEQKRNTPLKEFTRLVRLLTNTHTCLLTFVDLQKEQVLRIASSSQDQEFEEYLDKELIIHPNGENLRVSFKTAPKIEEYESLSLQKDGGGVSNPEIAKRFGLKYFYSHPIKIDEKLKGYLNFFSTEQVQFSTSLKLQIEIISKFAEIQIFQNEVWKNKNQTLKDAIEELANIKGEDKIDQILRITLEYSKKLLSKNEIFSSVLKFDEKTGMVQELKAIPDTNEKLIPFGNGYYSQALIGEEAVIRDSNSVDWKDIYIDAWQRGTESEMVIPLLIKKEQIRFRNNIVFASRPIGVLNFESRSLNEFTQEDVDILLPLTSQASLLIEKLAIERKNSQLRDIERQVLTEQNQKESLKIIAEGIRKTLDFEFINISLVDDSKKTINTQIVVGIEEENVEKFLQMASHSLSSKDIQAEIVRSKKIEVPDDNDSRFDRAIWKEFRHKYLIRVFVPVISSLTNKCVGTIEAGYQKGFRKHIYESDIQILQGFAGLVVAMLERQNSRILDKISHELRSPIAGILGNIDRLKAHHRDWEKWFIDVKLEDIELDCEILKHNILELEYFLGRPFPKPKIGDDPIFVMKDIVLKTIKQLKSLIEDEGFYFDVNSCIDREDLKKIKIYTDKIQLGRVFYNLLVNSIRYANKNSKIFKLKVIVDDETEKDYFIIRFQDWGIGIKEDYKNKIFDDYFRSPEANAQFVSGTGLGLTISRAIMRKDIKGDLILANSSNPTEFNVKIPKRYEKKPL